MFPFGIWDQFASFGVGAIPRAAEPDNVTAEIFEAQERRDLIVKLISGQDARKWDVKVLVDWASAVADEMLSNGGENGEG